MRLKRSSISRGVTWLSRTSLQNLARPTSVYPRKLLGTLRRTRLSQNTNQFTLTSVRSEGQFNTIIYSEEDVYRKQSHRQVLFINAEDLEKLGLKDQDKVDVSNATGANAQPKHSAVRYKTWQCDVLLPGGEHPCAAICRPAEPNPLI